MGHVRLRVLPRTRKWDAVVALIGAGTDPRCVAGAAAYAASESMSRGATDPGLADALWLLTSLPQAARGPAYLDALRDLGVSLSKPPSLLELTASVSAALDAQAQAHGARSDFGEMAQHALTESLSAAIGPHLPMLFGADPADVRRELGRLAQGDRFAGIARDFFSRLMHRILDSYLSRELANHVGQARRFGSDADRRLFDAALATHCHEAARIVETYAGGWYGKTVYQREALTRGEVAKFAAYAFKKLRAELELRRDAA